MSSTGSATLPPPLPPDVVLVHVGPHKTGTTTLQGAFHASREALTDAGVHYAGPGRHPMLAVLARTATPGRLGDPPPDRKRWEELVDEIRGVEGKRVVLSSEFLADGSAEVAKDVVAELGGDRVHVVVTLRPLSRIFPSQWQQYVQNGLRMTYVQWLDRMLTNARKDPPYVGRPTPTFWHRHAHGVLVERWADAAGPDNVTVVVLDESDRSMLMGTFEALLGVPAGTLVPDRSLTNRSLTAGEVELVRQLNEEFKRRHWSEQLYGTFVRNGIAKRLLAFHQPYDDEPVITTPKWGLEGAAEQGLLAAEQIRASGVRVIGDLAGLSEVPSDAPDESPTGDPPIPASAAATAVMGTILASRKAVWPAPKKPAPPKPKPPAPLAAGDRKVGTMSTAALLRVLGYRGLRRVGLKGKPPKAQG